MKQISDMLKKMPSEGVGWGHRFLNRSVRLIPKDSTLTLFAAAGIKRHELGTQYLLCNQKCFSFLFFFH